MNVENIVREHLAETLGYSSEQSKELKLDADLFDHYGLTSLTMVMLMTTICPAAKIQLSALTDRDVAKLHTPQDIINLIDEKLAQTEGI
ncbi:acyl carrier protein [Paraherbaspirillum soli]|uniref:Acyl carrier protein n=1 Tax=Paraherbaspirillum soli TaxID=631222 RepID=A0ABW0M6A4_9BURK